MSRFARATIDLDALRHNLAVARRHAPHAYAFAVLKANAYGHGLLPAAHALASVADGFAVSAPAEALPLRRAGLRQRILLLEGPFVAADLEDCEEARLDVVVHTGWQVEALERRRPGAPIDVWVKVDTGMHRLGFAPQAVPAVVERLHASAAVGTVRYMTHFACADDRDDPRTNEQMAVFADALSGLPGERSAANSAATLAWPASHADWVRPGIMLYGASPFTGVGERPPLRPVMTLQAALIAIQEYPAGARIGYGGNYICPEPMPVGVVSIGYGDGYPRHAPNGTPVLVGEHRAGLAGRVSMDMLSVDLRGHPDPHIGQRVTLWGEGLPAEEIATACGTISYELFCQVTPRVGRRHLDDGHGAG